MEATLARLPFGRFLQSAYRLLDKISVLIRRQHIIGPSIIGKGNHDCALTALYWAAPWLTEHRIRETFLFCTNGWPHAGVTNKEFQIVLKFLRIEACYNPNRETLGALLNRQRACCVALLPHHFIAIVDGKIVGRDIRLSTHLNTTVYCHWTFR